MDVISKFRLVLVDSSVQLQVWCVSSGSLGNQKLSKESLGQDLKSFFYIHFITLILVAQRKFSQYGKPLKLTLGES